MSLTDSFKNLFRGKTTARDKDLDEFQKLIGYYFQDTKLLKLSLTHRSFIRAGNAHLPSNERLEFLGDSVLGLIIAHQLYRDCPGMSEGELTKTKAMLVNETTLTRVARDIGLNRYIRVSSDEARTGGRERSSIISDAFESVIGAVYRDGGLEAARQVVLTLIYVRRGAIISDDSQRNFKGDLLELIQSKGDGIPRYEVVSETGPDHEKEFYVIVSINGQKVGTGRGLSKKEAEQKAASEALEYLEKPAD